MQKNLKKNSNTYIIIIGQVKCIVPTFQLDFEYKTALERNTFNQMKVLKYLSTYSCYTFNLGLIGGYNSHEISTILYYK